MTSQHARSFVAGLLSLFSVVLAASAAPLAAQTPAAAPPPSETIEAEPIRCWWRTSTGAVRTGETFTLVLTCAVLENEAVQIVPDESRLGAAVVQLAPFDVAGGSHPADLHTANRRFFQYDYVLRLINPDFIGHDVPIPDVSLHFRVNSRMSGNAAIQGRDFVYQLPPMSIKILGMVPGDAADIRDSSDMGFGRIESMRFRASTLRIVAVTLMAVGGLAVLLSLARLVRRSTRQTGKAVHEISDGAVLGAVSRELADIQRGADANWTADLAARALAASRIVAAYGLGRRPSQQLVAGIAPQGDGRIVVPGRRGDTVIWSAITPGTPGMPGTTAADLARAGLTVGDRREMTEGLHGAITTFTVAGFSRDGVLDRSSLDAALTRVTEAVGTLKQYYAWPRPLLRRWFNKGAEEVRRA